MAVYWPRHNFLCLYGGGAAPFETKLVTPAGPGTSTDVMVDVDAPTSHSAKDAMPNPIQLSYARELAFCYLYLSPQVATLVCIWTEVNNLIHVR